ncbi:putative nucleic acid binding protein [Hibiscus syriacus]|uniref:Nucleic acid binding protein n=1 Tax=Hibiscus syriacus TaxID=106335 RepID=A0A6A2X0D0_HIBSY|nr:putative nucleic acid binding protein [Hibiscus syriacus]
MLKSSLTPIFSTFPAKPNYPRLFLRGISCNLDPTPSVQQNASPNIFTTSQRAPTSVYIHLPFCRKRCYYSDFPIVALGSHSPTQTDVDDPRLTNYIQLLLREINASKVNFKSHPQLETVFFGGGTPSLVPPRLVVSILDLLRVKFWVTSDAEVSMEMDPGNFDVRKMEALMGLGVNRVSLGVQAFQKELLKACGSAHGVKEVYEAIEMSLGLTIEVQPNHVYVYDLQVEQGTKFGTLYTPGEFPLPSDVQSACFYRTASRMLSDARYNHFEINSYSRDGFKCKHNFTYWENKPFYGFGLGSASYVSGMRFSLPKRMRGYIDFVQSLENGTDTDGDVRDLASDVVMLSLEPRKGSI